MSANLTRLKKRIETLEKWVDDNEALAGPEGTLDTFNYLIGKQRQFDQMQAHLNQLQRLNCPGRRYPHRNLEHQSINLVKLAQRNSNLYLLFAYSTK